MNEKNKITFEKFTEKHIEEAVKLVGCDDLIKKDCNF